MLSKLPKGVETRLVVGAPNISLMATVSNMGIGEVKLSNGADYLPSDHLIKGQSRIYFLTAHDLKASAIEEATVSVEIQVLER